MHILDPGNIMPKRTSFVLQRPMILRSPLITTGYNIDTLGTLHGYSHSGHTGHPADPLILGFILEQLSCHSFTANVY